MSTRPTSRRTRKSDLSDYFKANPHAQSVDDIPPIPSTPIPDASPASKISRLSILPFLSRARTKSVSSHSTVTDTETELVPQPNGHHGYATDTDHETRQTRIPLAPSSSSSSLGSKLVAHLTPLKHRRSTRHPPSNQLTPIPYDRSHSASKETLLPPTPTPRSPSFDSGISRSTSVTPQPKITISQPPSEAAERSEPEREDLRGFADLFTPPAAKKEKRRVLASLETGRAQSIQRPTHVIDDSSPPATPRPGQSPASKIATRKKAEDKVARKSTTEEKSPKSGSSEKRRSLLIPDTLPALPEPAPRSTKSLERPAVLITGVYSEHHTKTRAPSTTPASAYALPLKSNPAAKKSVRRRAHTLSAASAPPSTPLPPSPSQRPSVSTPTTPSSFTFPTVQVPDDLLKTNTMDKERIDTASPEELREALRAQITRSENLVAYITTATDMHGAERSMLEQRIETLEKEAKAKEKEMRGLRFMVMSSRATDPNGSICSSASVKSAPANEPPSRLRSAMAYSPSKVTTNSESESGFDSASGLTPILRKRKPAGSQLLPAIGGQSINKRSSVSSFASTGTAASTTSNPGLTAIPESPTLTRYSHELTTPPSSDFESEKRQELDPYIVSSLAHRLSTSSASSAGSGLQYSGRSRPSSIAQVLQQSSGMNIRKSKNHS